MPRTEGKGQASFSPFGQREVSVLTELALGHLRYHLTDVPPQSNSPPHNVLGANHGRAEPARLIREIGPEGSLNLLQYEVVGGLCVIG